MARTVGQGTGGTERGDVLTTRSLLTNYSKKSCGGGISDGRTEMCDGRGTDPPRWSGHLLFGATDHSPFWSDS